MTDWKKVYDLSRMHVRNALNATKVATGLCLMLFLVLGFMAFFNERGVLVGALILWTIGIIGAGLLSWKAYRDFTGDLIIFVGKIISKKKHIVKGGCFCDLYLNVEENFCVTSSGDRKVMRKRTGLHKIFLEEKLYDRLKEGEHVTLLCLPTGQAFAKLEGLISNSIYV